MGTPTPPEQTSQQTHRPDGFPQKPSLLYRLRSLEQTAATSPAGGPLKKTTIISMKASGPVGTGRVSFPVKTSKPWHSDYSLRMDVPPPSVSWKTRCLSFSAVRPLQSHYSET